MSDQVLKELGVIDESAPPNIARKRVAEIQSRFGLTDSEIAKATDANPRTVARWRTNPGGERISRYDERIEQLVEIIDALEAVLHDDPKGVRQFLKSKNHYLDGARPLNLLGAGRYNEVRAAITKRRGAEPPTKKVPVRSKAANAAPHNGRSGDVEAQQRNSSLQSLT